MKLVNIFETAKRLLGGAITADNDGDLDERAPYIGAALCTEAAALDRAYRAAFGLPEQPEFPALYIELNAELPLCDRFAPAASYYMAAMLILDSNGALYNKLFDRWCTALAEISAEIPFVKGSTADVYPIF
ncbi:MAG: hypothetical protein ACI3XI_03825 [Eubacteriales bacterium]